MTPAQFDQSTKILRVKQKWTQNMKKKNFQAEAARSMKPIIKLKWGERWELTILMNNLSIVAEFKRMTFSNWSHRRNDPSLTRKCSKMNNKRGSH